MAGKFLIYGILLGIAFILGQRGWRGLAQKNSQMMLWNIGGLIIVGIVFLALLISAPTPVSMGDGEIWYKKSPNVEVLLFSVMLLGMAASYMTKQIDQRRRQIEEKRKNGDTTPTAIEFDFWEFSYPILISVITFGVVLQIVGDKTTELQSFILSFQTGFFWQTVLAKATPK